MKHGDKAKAKAASKASGKSSKAAGEKSSSAKEAGSSSKGKDLKAGKQAGAGGEKAEAGKAGGNGKPSTRRPPAPPPEAGAFTNPVVENAFKRAVQKYPNAFRRLTD